MINRCEIEEIMDMGDPSFCLEHGSMGPRLRKDHHYFFQVQGEMAVMSLPWCDFVLWTAASKNNIFVQRIHFDHDFVGKMLPKLSSFFFNHIHPKIMPES